MISEAIEIIKLGDPVKWKKSKEARDRVQRLENVYRKIFNDKSNICGWCSRGEMYKHLKKYLEGNGHL
jgi:hypothetical protein